MKNPGIPDVRGSPLLPPSPLVPGILKTSVPKFVPESGGMHVWSMRLMPTITSSTTFDESDQVVPTLASLTFVSPTPEPMPNP